MKLLDLTGHRFGRLSVLARGTDTAKGKVRWLCACECGRRTETLRSNLLSGHTRSCGCVSEELSSARGREQLTKHGHAPANGSSREYVSWERAKSRCFNPNSHAYASYGGRGIGMSEEWRRSFDAFLRDMGSRPAGTTLDRIDNDRGYEPGNCRWATPTQQANNRRDAQRGRKAA